MSNVQKVLMLSRYRKLVFFSAERYIRLCCLARGCLPREPLPKGIVFYPADTNLISYQLIVPFPRGLGRSPGQRSCFYFLTAFD